MATEGTEAVVFRGTINKGAIPARKLEPGVVAVYPDVKPVPMARGIGGGTDPGGAITTAVCPIPRCDCVSFSRGRYSTRRVRFLGVDAVWNADFRGEGIVVGVVDEGITIRRTGS